MRVTQSMLSNNMLRNLSVGYSKMGQLQDQIATGKKVNRPSDDPVVAMKGIDYRTQLDKVKQFNRNLGEVHNWLDSTDDALDKVGSAIHRARELMVDAANGTKTPEDREKTLSEIKQLRLHVQSLANSKVGDKYIFSGTNTDKPLYKNDALNSTEVVAGDQKIAIEIFDGVKIQVNTDGSKLFGDPATGIDAVFQAIETAITNNDEAAISNSLSQLDSALDMILIERADIGARQNRAELMGNRLETQEVTATKLMSENEDVDYEKVITEMITAESVHRAALSVGSRIIQPTLVDFLR